MANKTEKRAGNYQSPDIIYRIAKNSRKKLVI